MVADRQRKSIGAETTFARDLSTWEEVPPVLTPLFARIWAACEGSDLAARTVTVKVKYADFQQVTRGRSVADGVSSEAIMREIGFDLLRPLFPPRRGVRLLGATLSNFSAGTGQARRQLALGLG